MSPSGRRSLRAAGPASVRPNGFCPVGGRNARRVYETILKLQGLFIKVGQALSIMANFLPEAFRAELEGLERRLARTGQGLVLISHRPAPTRLCGRVLRLGDRRRGQEPRRGRQPRQQLRPLTLRSNRNRPYRPCTS